MSRQSSIVNFFTELTEVDCVPHPAFNPMDIEGTTLSRQLFVWRKMHGTKTNLPLVQMKSRQLGFYLQTSISKQVTCFCFIYGCCTNKEEAISMHSRCWDCSSQEESCTCCNYTYCSSKEESCTCCYCTYCSSQEVSQEECYPSTYCSSREVSQEENYPSRYIFYICCRP
uniref:Uncharacterized protein n=1 Tax=Aegilops tauschii subsp. strangulata TaxID=200361 RepID=A0A452XZI2_AEGTS